MPSESDPKVADIWRWIKELIETAIEKVIYIDRVWKFCFKAEATFSPSKE